jgi:hypothetical protein
MIAAFLARAQAHTAAQKQAGGMYPTGGSSVNCDC